MSTTERTVIPAAAGCYRITPCHEQGRIIDAVKEPILAWVAEVDWLPTDSLWTMAPPITADHPDNQSYAVQAPCGRCTIPGEASFETFDQLSQYWSEFGQ